MIWKALAANFSLPRGLQMAQTIPYLVARGLDNGKAADVHRVFAVRQAVPMFDFADERWASLLGTCWISVWKRLLYRVAMAAATCASSAPVVHHK